jgi:cellulose synthase/poly-beta-1,6-N-acetylglucosamine synthase-like glycosyltransferase
MLRAVRGLFLLGQAAAVGVSLYQTAVTLLGSMPRQSPVEPAPNPRLRFGLMVCARNEEAVVAGILSDLLAQAYPREAFYVLLVAHNTTDGTALVGKRIGAAVADIHTLQQGKGAAMRAGVAHLPPCDYVGVFDADSRVPYDMLLKVAAALEGESCVQIETVPHWTDDWLATGYGLGRRARNLFWWRPREALGWGTTVSGSGYFVRRELLAELLNEVHTLTEDLELTALLYTRGERVRFLSSTHVRVEEPQQLGASLRQRLRWVRGHFSVIRHYFLRLSRQAARGNLFAFDMALYLVVPSRVLTRTGVTLAFLIALVRLPIALPIRLVSFALACEWGVPAVIAARERLVPLSLGGLEAAARHGLLNLMWFPIGIWALLTPNTRAWDAMPRASEEERDAAPVA